MADYDDTKDGLGSVFPDRAVDGQEFSRVEPLITPTQLRRRQLFGVPLVSFLPNPLTGVREEVLDEDLVDMIERAVAEVEIESGLNIFPVQYNEKLPLDVSFNTFGYLRVEHRPVASVEKVAFTPANGTDIFVCDPTWIESANFHKGQINLIPMNPASAGGAPVGSAYFSIVSACHWVPAFVTAQYTVGFLDGMIPKIINEIIGITAALEVLALLAATNQNSNYSLSMDGGSQSVSNPGIAVYEKRMEFLEEKKRKIIKKLKNIYGLGIISGYV